MPVNLLGLRTHIAVVPDIAAAAAWYTKIFGFGPYFDQPFYVGFNVEGYEFGLQPGANEASTEAENVRVYWGVEDVAAAVAAMLSEGATVHEEPTEVGEGIVVGAVRDPWGNVFGVIFNPHFRG